jgi:putative ABC transport system permease protein
VTTAFPVLALFTWSDAEKIRAVNVGFPAHEYLSARMEMDRDMPIGSPSPRRTVRDRIGRLGESDGDQPDTSEASFQARFRATYEELVRRLTADPMVAQVTFANRLPRMYHPHRLIELDEGPAAARRPEWPEGYRVSDASVGPDYFDAVNAEALMGRTFTPSEHEADRGAPGTPEAQGGPVIVNESFVRLVMGGRNPVGRRLRYVYFEGTRRSEMGKEQGPWYEIVGVVRDLGMAVGADVGQRDGGDPKVAGLYHPIPPGGVYPAHVAVHVRGDPVAFAPRLQQIAAAVDPTLRLYQIARLDRVNDAELEFLELWFRLLLLVSGIALVLALAGIYSVMSFAVTRRTREIGVRVALGADRRRIVVAIFKRPIRQLAMGILVGAAIVAFLMRAAQGPLAPGKIAVLAGYTLFMAVVYLFACVVPTHRALRVQPTDALRAEE